MKHRSAVIFAATVLLFFAAAFRTARLSEGSFAEASRQNSAKAVHAAAVRGTIFDRNLEPLTNSEKQWFAAVSSPEGAEKLKGIASDDDAACALERASKGLPVLCEVTEKAEDQNGITFGETFRRYSSYPLAAHIIGYTSPGGEGVCGIEKSFDDFLEAASFDFCARFTCDANGRVLSGEKVAFRGAGKVPESGVILTIDKKIQQTVENALDENGINKGAAVVIEIATGDIAACASRPVFDPSSPSDSLGSADSPFLNRAFLGFPLGSAFKPVIAAAALENGIDEAIEAECGGETVINSVTFHCHDRSGHGKINMRQAMTCSCNIFFIRLSQLLTRQSIIDCASALGFGTKSVLSPGITSSSGNLPSAAELDSDAAKANLAFGQGTLLATPLQVSSMMACIAANGIYRSPRLVAGTRAINGEIKPFDNDPAEYRAISEKTAKKLKSFLEDVTANGTGTRAQPSFPAAGKTATAQTGKSDESGEICDAWFAGYFPADKPEYAVCIFKENGGEGALSCAPVFREIAEKTVNG